MSAGLRSEDGLTLVEVVVAMFVGLLGALVAAQLITASERNSYRLEQSQVVATLLQAELERIKQLPYAEIALTNAPEHVNDERQPGWRIEGDTFALRPDGSERRSLVINGDELAEGGVVFGGVVSPGPARFEGGDVSGAVHRYVVWVDDPGCPESLCPGEQDLKRVIVAATLDSGPTGERRYQEIHTDIADPDATPVENALPPGTGDEGTYVTFWLTDTSCDHDSRQALTGNHPARNTLGECAAGVTSGSTAGAPDLLVTEPPALAAGPQPIYDYSSDLEPLTGADADSGLQLRESSCSFDPSDQAQAQHRTHRWLSPRIPTGTVLELGGEATLALWTRTIGATAGPGQICIILFVRRPLEGGGHDDILLRNAGNGGDAFPHSENEWPTSWQEIAVSMDFSDTRPSLQSGERLGIAISGAQGGAEPALEFLYDNPSFDTRLVVGTSSEVPDF